MYVFVSNTLQSAEAVKMYGEKAPKPPLYGIYNVLTFIRNNDTITPLTTGTARWSKLIVSYTDYSFIKFMNDSTKGFAFRPDTTAGKIVMFDYNDTMRKSNLVYSFLQKDVLMLTGKLNEDSVAIEMKKYDLNNFLLISRGFHWVNEYPFNR